MLYIASCLARGIYFAKFVAFAPLISGKLVSLRFELDGDYDSLDLTASLKRKLEVNL